MFCTTCGAQIPAGNAYCDNCGRPAVAAATPQAAAAVRSAPAFTVGETEPKAIWSLVLGVLSVTMFSIFAGIPAIVLGHMARARIAQSMGRLQGAGMALAGLIMGYISLAVIPILVLGLLTGPHFALPTGAGEKKSAGSLQAIVMANEAYFAAYPHVGYAAELRHLGGTPQDETSTGLIDDALAAGRKSGYVYHYESFDQDGDGVREDYFVRADPESGGGPSYCSDRNAVIRISYDGPCTVESRPVQ